MSKTIVTLLLVALAVAPSLAEEQEKATKTAGNVTFQCQVEGSDKNGFTFKAKNTGSDTSCEATCSFTLTTKDGTSTKDAKFSGSVRGDGHPEETIGGEGDIPGKLTHPEITKASCK